jgi:hypothetical protein
MLKRLWSFSYADTAKGQLRKLDFLKRPPDYRWGHDDRLRFLGRGFCCNIAT